MLKAITGASFTPSPTKATVSFFTADKPANYTIIMEGLTPEGEIGYKKETLKNEVKVP